MGALSALLSGVFFGMFLVGSKICNDRGLHPASSLFYTMLFADAIALLLCYHGALVEAVSDFNGLAMGMALGGLLTLTPFFLYGWSTQYIEPTMSSMVSVLEIVSAALVGYFIFSETVSFVRIIGMGLVIASVIFLNIKFHKDYVKKYGEYVPPGYKEDTQPSSSNEPTRYE